MRSYNLCHIYVSFSSYNGYKLNSHLTCFQRGFIAQLCKPVDIRWISRAWVANQSARKHYSLVWCILCAWLRVFLIFYWRLLFQCTLLSLIFQRSLYRLPKTPVVCRRHSCGSTRGMSQCVTPCEDSRQSQRVQVVTLLYCGFIKVYLISTILSHRILHQCWRKVLTWQSTTLLSTARHGTARHGIVLNNSARHSRAQLNTAQQRTARHGTARHCTA